MFQPSILQLAGIRTLQPLIQNTLVSNVALLDHFHLIMAYIVLDVEAHTNGEDT